jgi:hypothetical protein
VPGGDSVWLKQEWAEITPELRQHQTLLKVGQEDNLHALAHVGFAY